MEIIEEPISGLLVIKPKVFQDARGYFFESFREDFFKEILGDVKFVQDNQSKSAMGIVRGLHFQKSPYEQGKLVRVIAGSVLDVAVDIRKSSKTYGKAYSIELSADNFLMMYIPPGFAHGFEPLQNDTIFSYRCTNYYHPASEGGIRWDSPEFDILWRAKNPVLSEKDAILPLFSEFESPFS